MNPKRCIVSSLAGFSPRLAHAAPQHAARRRAAPNNPAYTKAMPRYASLRLTETVRPTDWRRIMPQAVD